MGTTLRSTAFAVVLACTAATAPAAAQSLNVDFGQPADAPASTYAAAGLPGVWNSIQGDPSGSGTVYHLVGLDGRPTGVTLHQIGGTELRSASDPSVRGDDARLLNDALITYTPDLETCLFVDGLMPGMYEVLMYAWMPNAPAVHSRVRHDLSSTTVDVGGAWTGTHVERVTYARHILTIRSDGFMGSHSGIVPGAVAANGAALNGFQLRYLGVTGDAGTDAGRDAARDATATSDAGPDAMDAATSSDAGGTPGMDSGGTPGTDSGASDVAMASDTGGTPRGDAAGGDAGLADAGGGGGAHGCTCEVGVGARRGARRGGFAWVVVAVGLALVGRKRAGRW